MTNDNLGSLLLLFVAALVGGAINSVAGGGTLLTFPALIFILKKDLGLDDVSSKVIANATSTVALVPGSFASAWAYRRELRQCVRWLAILLLPSLAGGILGSLLVIAYPDSFAELVPWLILTAALLFLAQPIITKLTGVRPETPTGGSILLALAFWQFVMSIYGGYFGAGMGIVMLGTFGLMGMTDIHQMNAVKTFLGVCVNGMAVIVFAVEGQVNWMLAIVMAIAAILGGYIGAHAARRLNREIVRWLVIVIGFSLAAFYFYKQWTNH